MYSEYGLVVFDSTHEAIKTETLAKDNHVHARLIGTPGKIVAGCGLSLRYDLDDTDSLRDLLDKNNVTYKGFYCALRDGLKSSYTIIK